ncbi:hypothetical protein RDI58_015368 [Solanum bulbocastanum]|uniref:Calmodulin binding protein n=1 Tax=Solanum bulbocastanum TaxID=147425 RepID=A0AAN8TE72_SOLBU
MTFAEAAQSCTVILDTVESALPDGLPENFSTDCKLLETLNKAVELLPELWKLACAPQEAILSYRRALLYCWNLNVETRSKIEKEYAVFLLYSGTDAAPPNLRAQAEGSFIPRNNIEEAILLLLVLLRRYILNKIVWDPSILDHLSLALSMAGEFRALARQVEELLPGIVVRRQKYTILALCYYAEGDDMAALNLLRNLMNNRDNKKGIFELVLAAKICAEYPNLLEEGMGYAREVLSKIEGKCNQMASVAKCLLGLLLSGRSRAIVSDSERTSRLCEALESLDSAHKMTGGRSPNVLFHLSLENAEQRKLDIALYYAKQLLKLEGGFYCQRMASSSSHTICSKEIAQGHLRDAVETYTHLLAVLQVQRKSFGVQKKLLKNMRNNSRSLEMETWHDLANVYTNLSQWHDAEVCLIKSEAINPHSDSRCHSAGLLYQARGLYKEALQSFQKSLDTEPNHVPSLVSTAIVLRQLDGQSLPVMKSFLTDALRLDRTNPSAWYNLGLVYKSETGVSALEAAECFEDAELLQESAPVEPFR